MIDTNDDISEQRTSQVALSTDFDKANVVRFSEESFNQSQMKEVIQSNYESNYKPNASYSSLHDGLSSPEVNESTKLQPQKAKDEDILNEKLQLPKANGIIHNKPLEEDSLKKPEDKVESMPFMPVSVNQIKDKAEAFVELNPQEELIDKEDDEPQLNHKDSLSRVNIIKLYEGILNMSNIPIAQPFYLITVKEKVKDLLIGFHIVYEVSFYQSQGTEKETKCYRRYDNFDKLYKKLKGRYPYIMMPKLTPKKFIAKVTTFDEEFFEDRRLQLIFFLNFIANQPTLRKTKELNKFLNDASFDDAYFAIIESPLNALSFNSTPSEMIKTKIAALWNSIGSSGSARKLNDSELLINKMTTHYRNIQQKYSDIKLGIVDYTKTIKEEANDFKSLSEALYYIQDSFDFVEGSKEKLADFSKFSFKISSANQTNYSMANRLQNKLEALISLLEGICYSLRKYSVFIREYYDIITAKLVSAKEKNWENINEIVAKYDQCEILKNTFDRHLAQQASDYIELFDESTLSVLEQFKRLLMNINEDILG